MKDKYGNKILDKCPHCGGAVRPLRDVTDAIYGSQCAGCFAQLGTEPLETDEETIILRTMTIMKT